MDEGNILQYYIITNSVACIITLHCMIAFLMLSLITYYTNEFQAWELINKLIASGIANHQLIRAAIEQIVLFKLLWKFDQLPRGTKNK